MSWMILLPAAVFLPLFPLSMLFNNLFARVGSTWLRSVLLIAWPGAGLALLVTTGSEPPPWFVYWGVASALIYAFRALALRDLALWLGYIATSAWALLWLPAALGETRATLLLHLTAFSTPLVILVWLTGRLEQAFGAAYAGMPGGLAMRVPRLSGLLVLVVLAVTGTPLFPSFFALLSMVKELLQTMPVSACGVLLVWLLWAWAGMRMLQGLIVGQAVEDGRADIGPMHTRLLGGAVALLAVFGVWLSGNLL